jgi:dipeptidyl aminopeptidase/acylaminoacyl peptidase
LSNRGRDKKTLARLDLATGKETVVYAHPEVDLDNVLISEVTREPLAATAMPGYPEIHFFDESLEAVRKVFAQDGPFGIRLTGLDDSERYATLSVYTDRKVEHYFYDRDRKTKELLGEHPLSRHAAELAPMEPVAIKSRDGLTLHGYLTRPQLDANRPLPMVLKVHGGPWARSRWGLDTTAQFLANRGYAVLNVNYRGSSGYGRAFTEAAVGEFAGKMHNDLVDAVDWAIREGIADPDKVCIFGGSYGGYATLVGLTFTPDVFACGVDVVGPSNLVSLLESVPAYWRPWMPQWYKYVGHPDNPEDRRDMEARSPLFRVDQVEAPLLIAQGANDPRVNQHESDQIVAALEGAGKKVEYMLFPDEGHGIRHWKNRLRFYRKAEDFLAENLGGRSAGFDYYELGLLIF